MASFEARGSINKAGTLFKLPRGTKVSLFGSPWQERDFVLDGEAGTLSYYGAGQGGFAKHLKGELHLRGGAVRPVEGFLHSRVNCFVIEGFCDGERAVSLSAETRAAKG